MFFFFKQKTAYEMRISDWSSDVCSSDLMAKHKVKNAVEFIGRFEEVVARAAAERGIDGVVCGHIHTAEFRRFGTEGKVGGKQVEYWNDGDWVEGCNALVEHFDGRMEILHWPDEIARRESAATIQDGRARTQVAREAERKSTRLKSRH